MSEAGTYASLRQRYTAALSAGENSLRALLGSSSASWKPVQTVTPKAAIPTESDAILSKTEEIEESSSGIAIGTLGPIAIHRKRAKGAPDVVRAVCTVPVTDAVNALDSFRAVLTTHSLRDKWDPIVEKQEVLEIVEPAVTLVRTFTKIGWPSSARDIVTVNKLLQDPGKTLIYLSVSLPRSSGKGNDDPPFLQPSPPYIRSHMHICAFVVTCPMPGKARLSMYWQWDLKGSGVVWTNHLNAMPKIVSSLVEYSQSQASRIPYVKSWGRGVTFESETFDAMQDRLELHYGIFVEETVEDHDKNHVLLEKSKERRRLERSIEIYVPPVEGSGAGWNLVMPPCVEGSEVPWQVIAERNKLGSERRSRLVLRITHPAPKEDYMPVNVALQRLAGGKTLKLNGEPLSVTDVEERDPAAFTARTVNTPMSPTFVKPSASMLPPNGLDNGSHLSVTTVATRNSQEAQKTSQAQKDLLVHIRRSYAHFLSLLQSPAAKWRSLSEIRRVSISSYVAIDPAMIPIYKYEATFVNTTIWDLLAIFSSNGSRLIWDRHSGLERYQLVGELEVETTEGDMNPNEESAGEGRASFWEARWKAMWPTAPRETVFVRTTYRSPTSIHLLQTSVPEGEDKIRETFADRLSPSAEGAFRLQTQLQSVAFDQISPTTTSIVLVDQTNPKSWTKSGYNTMANAVANMGELVLKEGAPPLLTHLSRATLNQYSYHQEAAVLDVRYSQTSTAQLASVEAVLRLDFDVWSPGGAALLITPAPSRISAIGRHRLSEKGSGCWVTIEHQITQADQVPSGFSITVEKRSDSAVSGPSERNLLTVNGEFVKIGLEELNDAEIQARRMQKRIANRAIMLDRSPTPRTTSHFGRPPSIAEMPTNDLVSLSRSGTPPSKGFLPRSSAPTIATTEGEPRQKVPIDYAFEALTRLKTLYKETPEARADASDWTILSYAENNSPIRISKRFVPALSSTLPLYRVERTLPNVSEDQLLRLIQSTSSNVRTTWDDRIASSETIAYYENGSTTSIWIAQGSFPTRSRVAYVASVRAQEDTKPRSPLSSSSGHTSVIYVASASVPLSAFELDRTQDRAIVAAGRLNQSKLLESSVILEGWVLETTRSSKDDDDDEMEPQSYTKCSLFTCSDLPLMVVGSFGQAALRARLARMFDCLEASSKVLAAGAIPRFPIPSFDFTNVQSAELERPKPSFVKLHPRNATLVASMLSAIIIKVQLPAFEGRPSGSSVGGLDTASLLNDSGISQRSVSVQSVQHTENNLLEASSVPGQHMKAIQADPSRDIVIAELVLLRDPAISGYDIRTVTTLPSDKILPTDTSFWSKLSPVPFGAQVFPLLGNTKSASRYLLQVSLPTAQFTSPMEHPLSSLSEAPSLPRWYRKLTTEPGIVQLQATPIKAASQPAGRPLAPLKFVFDGAELQVGISQTLSVDQSGRLDELAPLHDSNSATPNLTTGRLPVVVNTAFLSQAPSRHKDTAQSPGLASPPLPDSLTPEPGKEKDNTEIEQTHVTEQPRQPIVDLFTATTVIQHGVAGQPGSRTTSERTYRLAFVVLVAMISFLLGSLLRSLLSPGDYIFFTRPLDSMEAAVWELLNPHKKWKFATRLLQLPIPGLRRDFVAALVEND